MPTKIGRYRVERRLGFGAFASVFLAEDDMLGSSVAIKVLADNWAQHPDVRARFEQEAQVLRRADSERLVRVHDFGELPDGRPYQVMTYASGGTLADRLAAGPMPIGTALRIAADIAEAVSVLHASGVLHRDLKPSNVLFDTVRGVERVLVADLGLAKSIAHASGFTVVAGSPGYMAPEQLIPGGGLDVRADVYGIGALAYEMLTGRVPGPGAPAPSRLRPGVPREVDRIVQRALDPDRDRRFPATAALAAAFTGVAEPRPVRWSARVIGAATALVALAALGGAADPLSTPDGWVRVTDDSRTLSIAVPQAWAGQARTAGRLPAVAVGTDITTWDGPGVFAGLSGVVQTHAGCTRLPDRAVRAAGREGLVQRWTGCDGSSSYSEVMLGPDVYVQIRQTDAVDRTDEVLSTLRVTRRTVAPPPPTPRN